MGVDVGLGDGDGVETTGTVGAAVGPGWHAATMTATTIASLRVIAPFPPEFLRA
jgi:hypothetical protein